MFKFFDKVIGFFKTIGELIMMMFKAIKGVWDVISNFTTNYIFPIATALPKMFGPVIGATLDVIIVVAIALLIWKVVK